MNWENLTDEFIDTFAGNWELETVSWYRARLAWWQTYAAARKLNKPKRVTATELNRFNGYLKEAGLKYSTRRGTLTALQKFFKWLARHKILRRDPFCDPDYAWPRPEREPARPITLAAARRMIEAAEAEGSPGALRDAAIMRVLLTAGLRREEVAGLLLSEVDLDSGEFFVRGKFGHKRRGFLKCSTLAALCRWLAVRPETPAQTVFVSLANFSPGKPARFHPLRPDAINEILSIWTERAGIGPGIRTNPHAWRHLFATSLAQGGNPFALQELMGHTDISVTNGYIHSRAEELRELVERYAPDVK